MIRWIYPETRKIGWATFVLNNQTVANNLAA